jgi:hypothetical protein
MALEQIAVDETGQATHLRYRVLKD